MVASSQIVNAYASATVRGPAGPVGLRGGDPAARRPRLRHVAPGRRPAQLTDEDIGLANVILTNGARLYVDHAHPEYSTPEVTNPLDIVRWDKAGEQIMLDAAIRAGQLPGGTPILLYKNNTDNKGASYGAHENYLMRRSTPFADIVRHLTPFFVSRQVVCGAGRVGIGQDGREHGFQISQRADYFEVEVGLETTLKRPIINTRDEPHADPEKYRRLHVIIGDANLAEISTYLKVGTTALVLAMIEDRYLQPDLAVDGAGRVPARGLPRPDAQAPDPAAGRPQADRRTAADGVPRPRQASTSRTARRRRRRADRSTCWPGGSPCSTGSSATRWSAPPSSTGWPSSSCSSATATATASTGTTPSCT